MKKTLPKQVTVRKQSKPIRKIGKAAPGVRLADIALSKTPKSKEIWIDQLDDDARQQLEELREMYTGGKLDPDWTPRSLINEVIEPAGIDIHVNVATFRKWLTGRG